MSRYFATDVETRDSFGFRLVQGPDVHVVRRQGARRVIEKEPHRKTPNLWMTSLEKRQTIVKSSGPPLHDPIPSSARRRVGMLGCPVFEARRAYGTWF